MNVSVVKKIYLIEQACTTYRIASTSTQKQLEPEMNDVLAGDNKNCLLSLMGDNGGAQQNSSV